MEAIEINFEGLPGPTHHFGGLSYGNLACAESKNRVSHPKAAALQCLEKMRLLADHGVKQAVLPPHPRPHLEGLKGLGFQGNDKDILKNTFNEAPGLLAAHYSASAMWTANAATVSPSNDTADGKVHITPANLVTELHRSLECDFTSKVLKQIFSDEKLFTHHAALPKTRTLADEGSANQIRLAPNHSRKGIEIFVYGTDALDVKHGRPHRYPARQTLQASQAIARLHATNAVFAQQNPHLIDIGVFHNDLISLGNENLFLYHSLAFVDTLHTIGKLKAHYNKTCGEDLIAVEIPEADLSPIDAVNSYLFNSQLITTKDGWLLVAPKQCEEMPKAKACIEKLIKDEANPIKKVIFVNLDESLANGGGPACLRLPLVLTEKELKALHPGVIFSEKLYDKLKNLVERRWRDHLETKDLADPNFMEESQKAFCDVMEILKL